MNIAIVILNWNGRQLLEQFLPSIIKHSTGIADVYVADNASTDDSVAYIKEHFRNVTIIENNENGGYAKGYNDALKNIKADVYALVNSDIEVTENWLQPIVTQFEKEPKTVVIQPKILDFKDKTQFEYAGAAGGFIDKYAYPYCRGRIFDTLEKDTNQYNDTIDIFWASGACFFIRAKIFHEFNGFDEDFFAHQEEIDLCWRIQNGGYSIKYIGTSTVYHVGGATLAQSNPRKTYLNFRNSLYSIVKNIPKGKLFTILFLRMLLDGIAAFKFLLALKPTHFLAVLKAHLSFYRKLKRFLSKRKELNPVKKEYYQTRSIIWQYFLLGRKRNSQIK